MWVDSNNNNVICGKRKTFNKFKVSNKDEMYTTR